MCDAVLNYELERNKKKDKKILLSNMDTIVERVNSCYIRKKKLTLSLTPLRFDNENGFDNRCNCDL